ncbi:MAG TPA: hypothetical protein VKP69_27140 [Isosphaeraceae bacterium]|nr:hypothetical protein [Isosphaeraceae bacterium]
MSHALHPTSSHPLPTDSPFISSPLRPRRSTNSENDTKPILGANGHDPAAIDDVDHIPACGVCVGGRLWWPTPDKPDEWALNAELTDLGTVDN